MLPLLLLLHRNTPPVASACIQTDRRFGYTELAVVPATELPPLPQRPGRSPFHFVEISLFARDGYLCRSLSLSLRGLFNRDDLHYLHTLRTSNSSIYLVSR